MGRAVWRRRGTAHSASAGVHRSSGGVGEVAGERGRVLALHDARALLPLLAPAIIIGGMWTGVFTPTEAAAVAAVYAIVITMLVYRELDARQLFDMVRLTMRDTAVVLIIVAAAALYAWFLVFAQIPQTLVTGIRGLDLDPFTILLSLNLFLLVVGLFMETNAAITVFTPMLLPAAGALALYATGATTDSHALLMVEHTVMFPAMLVAMLVRRDEYAGHHHAAASHAN